PLDTFKSNAAGLEITFEALDASNTQIYLDHAAFLRFHPPAVKDWLDRFLTEENVLSEIHSERTQTLSDYLTLTVGDEEAPFFDWGKILTAETRIEFDDQGEAREFETLYGSVSKIEDGKVAETLLPDGTRIEFENNEGGQSSQVTQTIVQRDGSVEKVELSYGRVRKFYRTEGSPLEYSYEFCGADATPEFCGKAAQGTELTVVFDPDTGTTERYRDNQLIARTQSNGITTRFEYNEAGELIHSAISYKGRDRESFQHAFTDTGNLLITTEEGITEEYSQDGKILFHTTPEGYRYAHQFVQARTVILTQQTETVVLADGNLLTFQVPVVSLVEDPEGEEVHQVRLAEFHSHNGDVAEYESEKGLFPVGTVPFRIKSVLLDDGIRIDFDRVITREVASTEGGDPEYVTELLDASVLHPDGTLTRFKDGRPFSVISAGGREILLETEGGFLIRPDESVEFHHKQAIELWNNVVLVKWEAFQLPPTLPVQMEYSMQGKLLSREFVEGVIELYNNGKIQEVLARSGERLVRYEYDDEGNPVRIVMEGARRRLESATLRLRAEIAVEREEALARIADREQVLNQTIEGEYRAIRSRLFDIRAQIQAKKDYVLSIEVKGKKAISMLSDAMSQINDAMNQVNGALENLARQRTEALEKLSEQVRQASAEVETEASTAFQKINEENKKGRDSILRQEITPVVYHWYRKILGRDPSSAEYDEVIAGADYESETFDLEGMKARLLSSEELELRKAQVEGIKNNVETQLLNYLGLSEEEKIVFAASLGILPEDGVELSASDIQSVLEWLKGRSLHFGQSAYLALEALLDDAGVTYERVELATRLILIDVLTGTLTSLEQEDLVISFYALKRVAETYGLSTYAMSMTYEGLRAMYEEACGSSIEACNLRVVAHINGNHYVIVTKVTEQEVTYIDPGAGSENSLQVMTLTKEEFLQAWLDPRRPEDGFGYLLSARPPPQA
ncbi:MAG TPA: cysteine peptidase family C39 domain-containing protein, partial [bacterium]|nr:cysteine peptidase family C39 domain-containing protein [bacterium]